MNECIYKAWKRDPFVPIKRENKNSNISAVKRDAKTFSI